LSRRIDQFLVSRGYAAPVESAGQGAAPKAGPPPAAQVPASGTQSAAAAPVEKAAEFVCEDDVKQAMRQGRKITLGERTIVTPAARDLGEQHRLFIQASWPR
jgi:hypothetical protein